MHSPLRSNMLCVAAIATFSIAFPAADALLQTWGVVALIALRNLLGFFAIAALWMAREEIAQVRPVDWLKGIFIGGFGFGLGSLLLLVSQASSSGVIAALAATTMPLSAVALEVILDGRKLTKWFLLGALFVVAGGLVATGADFSGLEGSGAGDNLWFGALIGFVAASIYAWGSRATVKNLPNLSFLGQTTTTTLGMALFAVGAFAGNQFLQFPGNEIPPFHDMTNIALLLVYAWIGLSVSQLLWVAGVRGIGVGIASFHLNAAPFYVMIFVFALGGSWNWQQAMGAAIVVAGVLVSQKKSKRWAGSDIERIS